MRDEINKLDHVKKLNTKLEEDLVNFKSCKNELSSIKQVQILHEGRQKMLEARITFLTDNLKLYRKCVCVLRSLYLRPLLEGMESDYTHLEEQLTTMSKDKEMEMVYISELVERNTRLENEYLNLLSETPRLDSSFSNQKSFQTEILELEVNSLRSQLDLKKRELGEMRGARE